MCSFTKKLQLLGDFLTQTPYQGSAPGPHWGTTIPQTPSLLLCPPPVRSTTLGTTQNWLPWQRPLSNLKTGLDQENSRKYLPFGEKIVKIGHSCYILSAFEVHSKYSNCILFEFLDARTVFGSHSRSILIAFVQHSTGMPECGSNFENC